MEVLGRRARYSGSWHRGNTSLPDAHEDAGARMSAISSLRSARPHRSAVEPPDGHISLASEVWPSASLHASARVPSSFLSVLRSSTLMARGGAPGWAHVPVASIEDLADECTQRERADASHFPCCRADLTLDDAANLPLRDDARWRQGHTWDPGVRASARSAGGRRRGMRRERVRAEVGDWMTQASSLHDGDGRAMCDMLVFEGAVVELEIEGWTDWILEALGRLSQQSRRQDDSSDEPSFNQCRAFNLDDNTCNNTGVNDAATCYNCMIQAGEMSQDLA
ncbi:hypothetical protein DFH09DRAFT_1364185 [Mycena vulgaris]|nr:hypothetical protein DFH09DRAFT_1364185 [Mycena vulgaris]